MHITLFYLFYDDELKHCVLLVLPYERGNHEFLHVYVCLVAKYVSSITPPKSFIP